MAMDGRYAGNAGAFSGGCMAARYPENRKPWNSGYVPEMQSIFRAGAWQAHYPEKSKPWNVGYVPENAGAFSGGVPRSPLSRKTKTLGDIGYTAKMQGAIVSGYSIAELLQPVAGGCRSGRNRIGVLGDRFADRDPGISRRSAHRVSFSASFLTLALAGSTSSSWYQQKSHDAPSECT
jgi:hypothetical protein